MVSVTKTSRAVDPHSLFNPGLIRKIKHRMTTMAGTPCFFLLTVFPAILLDSQRYSTLSPAVEFTTTRPTIPGTTKWSSRRSNNDALSEFRRRVFSWLGGMIRSSLGLHDLSLTAIIRPCNGRSHLGPSQPITYQRRSQRHKTRVIRIIEELRKRPSATFLPLLPLSLQLPLTYS